MASASSAGEINPSNRPLIQNQEERVRPSGIEVISSGKLVRGCTMYGQVGFAKARALRPPASCARYPSVSWRLPGAQPAPAYTPKRRPQRKRGQDMTNMRGTMSP